jgi:hypothetical protein
MTSIVVNTCGAHGSAGSRGYAGSMGCNGGAGERGQNGANARPVQVSLRFHQDDNAAIVGNTSKGQMTYQSVPSSRLGASDLKIEARGGDGGHGGAWRHSSVLFAPVEPTVYCILSGLHKRRKRR